MRNIKLEFGVNPFFGSILFVQEDLKIKEIITLEAVRLEDNQIKDRKLEQERMIFGLLEFLIFIRVRIMTYLLNLNK